MGVHPILRSDELHRRPFVNSQRADIPYLNREMSRNIPDLQSFGKK